MSWNIKTPGDYINGPLTVAGSATITGDLTVDTSTLKVDATNDRVGFGTASPAQFVHLSKSNTSTALTFPPVGGASLRIQNSSSTNNNFGSVEFYNAAGLFGASVNCQYTNQATPTNDLVFVTRGSSGGLEHYRIAADGVATWSEVGGIAGTAMTLNSTGLGIGVTPGSAIGNLQVGGSTNANLYTQQGTDTIRIGVRASGRTGIILDSSNATYTNRAWYLDNAGSSGSLIIGRQGLDVITFDNVGNVGIGATPSAWATYKAVSVGGIGASVFGLGSSQAGVAQGAFFNNGAGSGWAYSATSQVPAHYLQINGEHRFYNAVSGTAGAQITAWTQAMTLDASGNLLVGTVTSPTGTKIGSIAKLGKVSVEGTNTVTVTTSATPLAKAFDTGGLFFVSGFNNVGGSRGWFLVAAGGAAPVVIASDNLTGLTVAFTSPSGVLNMNTTSGSLSVTAISLTNQGV